MRNIKKLAVVLLGLCCISAVGGLAACDEEKTDPKINQTTVFIDKLAITMKLGETEKLTITGAGADTPTFVSSNENVATVDNNGNVTAVATGSATITVTVGGETLTCVINVPDIGVSNLVMRRETEKISIGGEKKLQVTIVPAIATNKDLVWSSSNESVATVDQSGIVRGIAAGTVTITAKNEVSGKTATCEVTVGTPVTGVTLNMESVAVLATETVCLTATITPSDALIQDITWTSSDNEIAVVNAIGEVLGVSEGTATITATTADGNKVATCAVTVTPFYYVDFIEFDKAILNMGVGQESTLSPIVTPENATDKRVTWSSSSPDVVSVDAEGKLTANKAGAATITVTSVENVYIKNTLEVNVIGDQATFRNKYYAPEGNFTFTAYNVNEVNFNGAPLADSEYTYANGVVTVAKSVLTGKSSETLNTLTFVSAESGDATVNVRFSYAMGTTFAVGELGTEIFGYTENVGVPTQVNDTVVFEAKAGVAPVIALNVDYLKAMFAYPNTQALNLNISVENMGDRVEIRTVKSDGTLGMWRSSIGNTLFTRTAFNKIVEEAESNPDRLKKNIYLTLDAGNIGDGAKIIVNSVRAWYNGTVGNAEQNRLYVDMPEDETLRIELGSPATALSATFQFNGQNYDPNPANEANRGYTLEDNVFSIKKGAKATVKDSTSTATVSDPFALNGKRLWVQTLYGNEVFYIYSASTPDSSQTFTKGAAYTFPLANNQAALLKTVIVSATLDGQDILAGGVAGVSVTDEGILFATDYAGTIGQHRLVVRTERTYVKDSMIWTAIDTYDRIITAQ